MALPSASKIDLADMMCVCYGGVVLEREVEGEKKGRRGYFLGMGTGSKTGEYGVEGEKLCWRVQRTIELGTVEDKKRWKVGWGVGAVVGVRSILCTLVLSYYGTWLCITVVGRTQVTL